MGESLTTQASLEATMCQSTAELLESQRQRLQSEKLASVGQLAAGIAHEINTPIQYVGDNLRALEDFFRDLSTVITKYREVLARARAGEVITPEDFAQIETAEKAIDLEYIQEDAPQAIAQALEGVQRVAHIVRAMKDFSHVEREELVPADLNHSIESTLVIARNEYKYVADVETHLGELPIVECYVGEVNQVLLNILVNAAHAIAETGRRGRITITSRSLGDQVEISISDTGNGIPANIRDRVFDPFFTTKPVGKGTGQGLNIAYQIICRKHKGSLTFNTRLGEGTTFFIRIPVRQQSPEDQLETFS